MNLGALYGGFNLGSSSQAAARPWGTCGILFKQRVVWSNTDILSDIEYKHLARSYNSRSDGKLELERCFLWLVTVVSEEIAREEDKGSEYPKRRHQTCFQADVGVIMYRKAQLKHRGGAAEHESLTLFFSGGIVPKTVATWTNRVPRRGKLYFHLP